MAKIHVIVQAAGKREKHGLDIAVDYYQQFPTEPSPAGDMDLSDAKFTKVKDITFDQLLVELAKAPAGGTALIICHAHDEFGAMTKSGGLLMPLAEKANINAQDDAVQILLEMLPHYGKYKRVRTMPSATADEKKAKSEAWIGIANDFNLGFPPDGAALPQLERFFEQGLQQRAQKELRLSDGPSLKSLLDHVEAVRSLKLERVEFRACKIGHDEFALKHFKELFGCKKLLAPRARTFYLNHMPIDNLDRFDHRYISEHSKGKFFRPGTVGHSVKDPADFFTGAIRKDPKTRLFWDVEFYDIPPANPGPIPGVHDSGGAGIKLKGKALAMIVEEVGRSWYRGSAGTWHEDSTHKPLWDDASKFVHEYVMSRAKYSSGDIMVSGFWTPDDELPWLLPNEPEYVDHITQV